MNDASPPTLVGSWTCPPGNYKGFYWNENVGFVTLTQPPPGTYEHHASDMNNLIGKLGVGQIAGTLSFGQGNRAFLWNEGNWTIIPPIPGATYGSATAISDNSNYVVGSSGNIVTNNPPHTAFRWKPGELTVISVPYGPYSFATDVSADGSILVGTMGPANGHHAFVWTNGAVTDLGTIPGGYTASPTSINSHGQILIVGRVDNPGGPPPGYVHHCFIWHNGTWTQIQPLPGYDSIGGQDLTDSGAIIGAMSGPGMIPLPYFRKNGVTLDLNDAIPSQLNYFILSGSVRMNHADVIVCEIQPQTPDLLTAVLSPVYPIPGDTNCDDAVDVLDLLMVINAWGAPGGYEDLDGDGTVQISDLEIVLLNWGMLE